VFTLNPEQVKQKAKAIGFHAVGFVAIGKDLGSQAPQSWGLTQWLQRGDHADMGWMTDSRRLNILQVMPEAQSLISLALNYYTPHAQPTQPVYGKIARYARGRDYHRVMEKRLKLFARWLKDQQEGILTRYYVDSGPIQEKPWAERAGLGWIGKNGNLITRQFGSWVVLGEVITNGTLTPDTPHNAHCGTCTRCISACPTQAIRAVDSSMSSPKAFAVDANRCIAYHTIENRAEQLPSALIPHLNGWIAGCDICQEVCPWNQRFAQPTDIEEFQPYPSNLAPRLHELSNLTDHDWNIRFPASALRRIKPAMFRRNAKAVMTTRP